MVCWKKHVSHNHAWTAFIILSLFFFFPCLILLRYCTLRFSIYSWFNSLLLFHFDYLLFSRTLFLWLSEFFFFFFDNQSLCLFFFFWFLIFRLSLLGRKKILSFFFSWLNGVTLSFWFLFDSFRIFDLFFLSRNILRFFQFRKLSLLFQFLNLVLIVLF